MPGGIFAKVNRQTSDVYKHPMSAGKILTTCTSPPTTTRLPQVNTTTFITEPMATRDCFTVTTIMPFSLGGTYILFRHLRKHFVIA
jgi:hypothetical protein